MTPNLADQCFRQGFERGLRKAAMSSSLGRAELEALGQRLFSEGVNPTSVWQGLKAHMLPGWGQRQQVTDALLRHGPDHPSVQELFHQIGATAHPKIQFWGRTMPIAAGTTGGSALGLAGGQLAGAAGRQQEVNDKLHNNMSLWDRLKYVVMPQSLDTTPSYGLPPTADQ